MVVRFFYRGQFTLLTQLIILNYPVILSHRRSTTVSLESVIQELWVAFKSERKSPWLEIDSQPLGLREMVFSLITTTLYIYRYYFFTINVIIIVNIIFCNACFVKLLNTRRPRDLLDWIAIDMPQFEFMNKIYQMFCSSLSCKPRLGLDKWWVYVWQFSLHWLKYRKGRQRTCCFDLFTNKDWHNIKPAFYTQLRSPAQKFVLQ